MFYQLKPRDWFYLTLVVALMGLWIGIDQLILHQAQQRMIAFPVVTLALLLGLFVLVKPARIWPLANTLTLIIVSIYIILSLIIDVVVLRHGFPRKLIVLWLMTAGVIYLAAGVYAWLGRKTMSS